MRILGPASMLLIAVASVAHAVDGIAVSVSSSSTNSYGHHLGNIMKYVIKSSKADGGTPIYSGGNARCVSINPSGTRIAFIRGDGKVCMQSLKGGEVTVLASIPIQAWLDFPHEDWVIYTNKWKGDELWKVNTSGTPSPVRFAAGLGSAMQIDISKDMKRGACVTCCYSARSFTIANGKVSFVSGNAGCGTGIAPSGNYFSNNLSGHTSVAIRNFSGSQLHKFSANKGCGGGNWNRNRWSANSDDWVTFTQGIEVQLGGGHHQVLYKKDGSECVQVQPLVAKKYFEGDDFWVGSPAPTVIGEQRYLQVRTMAETRADVSVYNLLGAREGGSIRRDMRGVVILRSAGQSRPCILQLR